MRICIPKVEGRGAGLANEMLVWGKAFVAARALGIRSTHPAWGLNHRRYDRYFGTSRWDWLVHRALAAALPKYCFDKQAYDATGEHDYAAAIRAYADGEGLMRKRSFVLQVEGMWGGYEVVRPAREYLLGELFGARGVAINMYETRTQMDPDKLWVAFHIRMGDYLSPNEAMGDYRGLFNRSLPMDWYIAVAQQLQEFFPGKIEFLLFSDGDKESLKPFTEAFHPWTTLHQKETVISDLLSMLQADVLVCSVSSFSMWAAFMSGRPYLWFRDQLQDHGQSLSLWGHEADQQLSDGQTVKNMQWVEERKQGRDGVRGVPLGMGEKLPQHLVDYLQILLTHKNSSTDLLSYGVVPK